jgi:cell cycle checkpoint protein
LAGAVHGDSRDTKLSTFHALGKLLYAKRVKVEDITIHDTKTTKSGGDEKDYRGCAWNRDLRPPLQFNPERVLDDGDIGISGALSFVQCHAPDFFLDITELGQAFDRFSDAAFLLDTSIEVRH